MELLKNIYFWAAIAVGIAIIWQMAKRTRAPEPAVCFSLDDIGYRFIVESVDMARGIFSVRYMADLQSSQVGRSRTNTCVYRSDGIPEEVLAPGSMFITVKNGTGLKFQRAAFISSRINGWGSTESMYECMDESYSLSPKYLQGDSGYVGSFGDFATNEF